MRNLCMLRSMACWILLMTGTQLIATDSLPAQEPVFSGPQRGESLPALRLRGVRGSLEGQEFDFVGDAGGEPIFLVFFHKLSRPAFGMTRTITRFYTAKKAEEGLHSGVVFLTDDSTQTLAWAKRVQHYFAKEVVLAISPDGKEGPGAYGLNRNVVLTILVAKDGKVTANFALRQPSLQVDGPPILKAIAEMMGQEPPTLDELLKAQQDEARRMRARRKQTTRNP